MATARSVDAKISVTFRSQGPLCLGFPDAASGGHLPDYFFADDPCLPSFSVEPTAGVTSFTVTVPGTCAKQAVRFLLRFDVGQILREGQDVPCEVRVLGE